MKDAPSNLVGCIAAYHVPDGLVTTWMVRQPRIGFEDFIVYYKN
jgi:hypothetical protein